MSHFYTVGIRGQVVTESELKDHMGDSAVQMAKALKNRGKFSCDEVTRRIRNNIRVCYIGGIKELSEYQRYEDDIVKKEIKIQKLEKEIRKLKKDRPKMKILY
jgi:hypothetical protein